MLIHFDAHRQRVVVALRCGVLASILCAGFVIGCAAGSDPPQAAQPAFVGDCPQSVFTPEQMRARVDCHPSDYKLIIDEDTAVLFAFPAPALDWVGPIFIIHVPSVSEVVLDTQGGTMFESYKSSEGQAAIERVLNNTELMLNILDRVN